jgi:hypothetical protein
MLTATLFPSCLLDGDLTPRVTTKNQGDDDFPVCWGWGHAGFVSGEQSNQLIGSRQSSRKSLVRCAVRARGAEFPA